MNTIALKHVSLLVSLSVRHDRRGNPGHLDACLDNKHSMQYAHKVVTLITRSSLPQARQFVPGPGMYDIAKDPISVGIAMGKEPQRPTNAIDLWLRQVVSSDCLEF